MSVESILALLEADPQFAIDAMRARKLADDSENNDSAALAEFVATLDRRDANPNHHPAGSPKGGQFAPKGTGAVSLEDIPSHEEQAASHKDLTNYLMQLDTMRRGGGMPAGMDSVEGFLLKNGKPYFVNAETYAGARDTPKMCYMNATQAVLANPDRTYVEGYITTHGVPIMHAWTVDKSGQVYDSTINPKGGRIAGYIGVPFSTKYLLDAAVKNKVYGLLGYDSKKTLIPLLEGKTKFGDNNPFHEPAGSREGGQFAHKEGGESWSTIEEARKGFYEKHGVSIYSEIEPKGIRILDQMKAADKTLTEMKTELPSFSKYSSLRMIEVDPRKEYFISLKGNRVAGAYTPELGRIKLAGILKMDTYDKSITWGKFTVGGTDTKFHPVLVHELGHSFQDKLIGEARRRKILSETERIDSLMKTVTKKDLSEYGMSNAHEFFAESFAAWRHPTYATGTRKIHPKIEQMFNILKEPA